MSDDDCACGFDGDWRACIDGAVYGPCEDEHCGGICEHEGDCRCECHKRSDTQPAQLDGSQIT